MKEYDAIELAFKNGYEKGKAEAAKEILEDFRKYISPHFIGTFNCIYIDDVLYEIEKKYTEGGDDLSAMHYKEINPMANKILELRKRRESNDDQ